MSSIIFVGLSKLANRNFTPVLSAVRFISSKHSADVSRPKPFPYETKNFDWPYTLFEDTEDRFNQNSKIIVVEGPIASGKTEFCKKLADELDMYCLPPANMDMFYKYGDFDYRSLDSQFSTENLKSYDEKTFCKNPNHVNSAAFQFRMLELRFSLYIDALAHMLSTGQGVVLQRSPFSDFVFAEAMDAAGYMSKRAKDIYYQLCKSTMITIFKPHLVIYLDTPVSKVKENIKKRNNPWEVNSPVFANDTYLQRIEDEYKNEFLPTISNSSEVLVYDWSDGGDHEVVVEDIERIDFDNYSDFDTKLKDWRILTTKEYNDHRQEFADNKHDLMKTFNTIERHDAPELVYKIDEVLELQKIVQNTPELYYHQGFIPKKDGNLLFKYFTNKKSRKPFIDIDF